MLDPTRDDAAGHPAPLAPIGYLRGLEHLIPPARLAYILTRAHRQTRRHRRLDAADMVWLVIALSLFRRDSVPMTWRRLHPYDDGRDEPDDSAFSKARQRLGVTPLREVFRAVAVPLATPDTPAAFYHGWRLMAIDGTTLDLPDTPDNVRIFGRGGNQRSPNPFPQLRALALCEVGTHAICGLALRPIRGSEQAMVRHLVPALTADMLLLWDRGFFGYDLIAAALRNGGHLLARVKATFLIFQRRATLPDGSYLSAIDPSESDRRHDRNGRVVRLIEYTHNDPNRPGCGVVSRLLTDLLDPADLPAREAVRLFHRRWEEELVFDEIKTHQNGCDPHLRSKTPAGVVQELYGLVLAHRVIRQVMADAAGPVRLAPEQLSFLDTLRLVQCHLPEAPAWSPADWYARLLREVGRQLLRPRRERWYPRVVKRQQKKWRRKRVGEPSPPQPTKPFAEAVVIT